MGGRRDDWATKDFLFSLDGEEDVLRVRDVKANWPAYREAFERRRR